MAIGEAFDRVLASAQAGDHDALSAIYRDVAPLVLGYLRSNRVVDAEDVASDVFVSMVQGLGAFSGTEKQFRSWMLTIAHRRMVDHVRRRVRQPEPIDIESADTEQLAATPTLERDAMTNLACRELADAMDELSELQRQAMMLRALADLTVPEVARVMDKPESAVKALLRRATANLARAIEAGRPRADDAGLDEVVTASAPRIGTAPAADRWTSTRASGSDGVG